jgi:hypothetical protein
MERAVDGRDADSAANPLLWGINVHHWLSACLLACAENGGHYPQDLTAFLPWTMSEEGKHKLNAAAGSEPAALLTFRVFCRIYQCN